MIDFGSIAIFVLATTTSFLQKSYLNTRIVPISQTWGRHFPHLYFVFGRNSFDRDFLVNSCSFISSQRLPDSRRGLIARTKQSPNRDVHELFLCSSSTQNYTFTGLYIANCTGEYFGIGPTCRAQEAMRFYYNNLFEREYFFFLDDDVYFRPVTMLSFLSQAKAKIDSPFAVIFNERFRGFEWSKRWSRKTQNCSAPAARGVYFAQPMIINRGAMAYMRLGIESNGMTTLQNIWGASHDAILGVFVWLHAIPLCIIPESYIGWPIFKGQTSTEMLKNVDLSLHFVFHKVRNQQWGRLSNFSTVGQQDLERIIDAETEAGLDEAQKGEKIALTARIIRPDKIVMSAFLCSLKMNKFQLFTPDKCNALANGELSRC